MPEATLLQKLRYRLDNALARGPIAFMVMLFGCAVVLNVLIAMVVVLFRLGDQAKNDPWEVIWWSLTSMLDPGTFAALEDWEFRIPMLFDTISGIILVSAIVAIMTNTLDGWMQRLRRGRTNVVEEQHTVILGWSNYIVEIVEQIILAHDIQQKGTNRFQLRMKMKRPCITVLADMDKADMEDYLREHVKHHKKAKIRCRRGSPIDVVDLQIVNSDKAKSIIVLRSERPYAEVELMKILLTFSQLIAQHQQHRTLRTLPTNAQTNRQSPQIVAEMTQTDNVALLEVVDENPMAQLIQVGTFVSRLIAQSSLQPGLSYVYNKLFDFADNDILFIQLPNPPATFGDAVLMYENGIVIGIQKMNQPLKLNPPYQTPLESGDSVIVIGFDAFSLRRNEHRTMDFNRSFENTITQERLVHRTLLIGWNWRTILVIRELDAFALPGSTLTLLIEDLSLHDDPAARILEELQKLQLTNLVIQAHICDTTNRDALRAHMTSFDHVIIMAYASLPDKHHADAHTIMTLSHMRHFLKTADHRYNIVTEIMDSRNRSLMASTDVDDFVISDKLVSMYLAQIAHEPRLHTIYTELLTVDGNEIYLKPVNQYVDISTPVLFQTLVEAALLKGEIVIGYRYGNVSVGLEDRNEISLNPGNRMIPLTFHDTDRLIVISEQE